MSEGKIAASDLICKKIADMLPNKSKVRFAEGFKKTGKNFSVSYVQCDHKTRMPVRYKIADLKKDHELLLHLDVKCDNCFLVSSVNSAPNPNPELTEIYKRIANNLTEVLSQSYHQHMATPDPLKSFIDNRNHLLNKILTTTEAIIQEAITNYQLSTVPSTSQIISPKHSTTTALTSSI